MVIFDGVIFALFLLSILNYWVQKSILYPPFIFCVLWCLDLSVYQLHLIAIDDLHNNTLALILAGALLFSAGGLFSIFVPKRMIETRVRLISHARQSKIPKYFLLVVVVASFPLVLHHQIQAASQAAGSSFLQRSKNAAIEDALAGRTTDTLMDYIVNSAATLDIVVVLIFGVEAFDGVFYIALAVTALIALSGGGRNIFLSLLVSVTGMQLIKSGRLSAKSAARLIAWPLLLFTVIFFGVIFTVKDLSAYSGLGGILGYLVVGYVIGPTAALDRVLQQPAEFQTVNHTLQFLLKPAATLHLISYTPPPALDNFITVPFPTNVYTVYRFFFTDFGLAGCLGCICLIGALQTLLYRRAVSRGRLSMVLFALSLYPLVMVLFDDRYYAVALYARAAVLCTAYWAAASLRWWPMGKQLKLTLLGSGSR